MKALNALVLPLVAASCLLLALPSDAQRRPGGGGSGGAGASGRTPGGGGASGAPRWNGNGAGHYGGRHNGGGYNGGSRYYGGGGRYYGGYYGHRHYASYGYYRPYYWGAYWAAPFLWGAAYWGYPGYYGNGYPGYGYGYPPAQSYPVDPEAVGYSRAPGEMLPPTTEVPMNGEGAPVERPLYLNFCASAQAYYPKVQSCPQGWQMRRPQYQ